MKKFTTIDQYIKDQPKAVQVILQKIRREIQKTAPKAIETISYGMPAFKLNGKVLVYFAAWKEHIGFYALPSGNAKFKKELSAYKTTKGAIQFPLVEKIPHELIIKIVQFRIKELTNKK